MRLVGLQLRFNISSRIVFELLAPRLDEVDVGARTDVFAARIGAVIASADPVPVQSGGAVGLCSRPFADNDPVVGIGGVATNIVANRLPMLLHAHQLSRPTDTKNVRCQLTQGCMATPSLEKT